MFGDFTLAIKVKRGRDYGFGDSKVERGRELVLFLGFYLGSNFGLYSKGDFLTKMADVGNGGLTKATPGGLSDNF